MSLGKSTGIFVVTLLTLSLVTRGSLAFGAKFGDACVEDQSTCDMSQSLTCKNGSCSCEYTWQTFDPSKKECLSPLGGFCQAEGPLHCTPNAQCSSTNQFLGFCLCNPPFEAVTVFSCNEARNVNGNVNGNSVNNRATNSNSNSNSSSAAPLMCCPAASVKSI